MTEPKCGCEGGPVFHSKVFDANGNTSDKILDIRNPKSDSRIIFKACENCHQVLAFWGDYFGAEDIPERDKAVAKEILDKKSQQEERNVSKEESRIITPPR